MRAKILQALIIVLCLTSCGSSEAPPPDSPVEPSSIVIEAPAAPPNWDDSENGVYFYIAELSEKDREEGKAAGSVIGFRYFGTNDKDEYVLAMVDGDGRAQVRAYCRQSCSVIRYEDGSRIAYTPNSVIGAAFEDAMRGHLVDSSGNRSATASAPPARFASLPESDWDQLGMGCACTFQERGSNNPILMAGGDDNLIVRPGGAQQICTLREGRMQEMFDGDVTLGCANSRISIKETGARQPGGDGHSANAVMTVSGGGQSINYEGTWGCYC